MLVSFHKLSKFKSRVVSIGTIARYSRPLKARALSPSSLEIGGGEHGLTSKNVFYITASMYKSTRLLFFCIFGWLFHCVQYITSLCQVQTKICTPPPLFHGMFSLMHGTMFSYTYDIPFCPRYLISCPDILYPTYVQGEPTPSCMLTS